MTIVATYNSPDYLDKIQEAKEMEASMLTLVDGVPHALGANQVGMLWQVLSWTDETVIVKLFNLPYDRFIATVSSFYMGHQ